MESLNRALEVVRDLHSERDPEQTLFAFVDEVPGSSCVVCGDQIEDGESRCIGCRGAHILTLSENTEGWCDLMASLHLFPGAGEDWQRHPEQNDIRLIHTPLQGAESL